MKKFHSTVTRRDFMKAIGFGAASLGAVTAAAPVFHDLDEAISSKLADWKRAWYVKNIDKPTVEIDWSQVERINQKERYKESYSASQHPDAVNTRENAEAYRLQYIKEHYPDWEGDSLRDLAVNQASSQGRVDRIRFISTQQDNPPWGGYHKITTPEDRGMSKWQGTPEEALRMLRTVFRFIGRMDVGCFELDQNTRKLIFSVLDDGKAYEFADVDQAYETETKRVIPNKCKWLIVVTELQATDLTLMQPSMLGKSATNQSYSRLPMQYVQMDAFIRGIGYQAISGLTGYLTPSQPRGFMSGIGEHGRMGQLTISPEYGSMLRDVTGILTDLPVASTSPIDAGIFKFCENCKICAEKCLFGSLETGGPSWDHTNYTPGGFNGYRWDSHKCPFCTICMAVCPFNGIAGGSMIHDIVRGTVATTSLFNGFFSNLERTFNYGFKDPRTWWESGVEPVYGIRPAYIDKVV